MPDPIVVGRALTALADPDAVSNRRSYEHTIASASDAFSDIVTAAQFLDDGGEATLRRAVGAASRDGHPCARTGRALLRDLARLRESIGHTPSSCPSDGDHFHSGRTTVFSGGGEPTNR